METGDQLLRRCQEGDERALSELVRHYERRVFHLVNRVAGDPSLAEEAVVETFYKVWRHCGQFSGRSRAETWIFRIALRAVLDLQRDRRRWWRRAFQNGRAADEGALHDENSGDPALQSIRREQLSAQSKQVQVAIMQLRESDRALVHLYYYEEKSLAEISEIVEVSRDALKMRLLRVRQRLGKLLQ